MYVCSRERGPMGGGSCFGVKDPAELRPESPTWRKPSESRPREPLDYPKVWKVYARGSVIGDVREIELGKFKAVFDHCFLPGHFSSLEEAGWEVFVTHVGPPF